MNNYAFYLSIIVIFNYFILNVLADNKYYIVSIRSNSTDEDYDSVDENIQNEIDLLVNDRMNDIYDIISENKETYVTEEGKIDEKLDELNISLELRKRSDETPTLNKNFKFQFINKNRPQKLDSFKLHSDNDDIMEYIPFESQLVSHICPVLNYYVVIAYLSDEVVNSIKSLPNIISCVEATEVENMNTIPRLHEKRDTTSKMANRKSEILRETRWKDLGIQDHDFSIKLINSHLSLISQGKFVQKSNNLYDNNYYYPASAGQGIDIYIIDGGLDTSYNEDDFDTYEGTSDERIIRCDGEFYDGRYHPASNERNCVIGDKSNGYHGSLVAISAAGTVNGVAKKANLHMLATDLASYDILSALDYIIQKAKPNKSVVNVSRGCKKGVNCYSREVQDKVTELVKKGVIIIVAAGNTSEANCKNQIFTSCKGVIPVGAINNEFRRVRLNYDTIYEKASYSSFGDCVELFAPGTLSVMNKTSEEPLFMEPGTSFASPMVAGVVSTIMSDQPSTRFDYNSMKKKLVDLSLKNVIQGLDWKTPNRFVNNGKKSVLEPPRCDDTSGQYHCQQKSCSKYGFCVDPKSKDIDLQPLCYEDNGCRPEYGYCKTKKCGPSYGQKKCAEDECCSKNGECIPLLEDRQSQCFVENGCLREYSGECLTYDINDIGKYDDKYHLAILDFNCKKELKSYEESCLINFNAAAFKEDEHARLCEKYEKNNCKEFFASPIKFAPSCEKPFQKNPSNYKINVKPLRIAETNLYCGKKSSSLGGGYCENSDKLLIYHSYQINNVESSVISEHCPHRECRELLLERLNVGYNYMTEKKILFNKKDFETYEKYMNYLKSNECTSQERN